jgi:hypothetical protein
MITITYENDNGDKSFFRISQGLIDETEQINIDVVLETFKSFWSEIKSDLFLKD